MDKNNNEGALIIADKRYLQFLDEAKRKVSSTRIQIAKAHSCLLSY